MLMFHLLFNIYHTVQIELQCGKKKCIISFHDSVQWSVKFETFKSNYELLVSFNTNGNFCEAQEIAEIWHEFKLHF